MADLLEGWLDEATPDEITVRVSLNRKLLSEYSAAVQKLLTARDRGGESQGLLDDDTTDLVALSEQVVQLEQQVEQSKRPFTFRCVERETRRDLQRRFPATDEQRKAQQERNRQLPPGQQVDVRSLVDPDEFYPELMAAACVSPGMTVGQAVRLREVLPESAWEQLVEAVQQVNVEGALVPKSGSSIGQMLRSVLSSTTRASEVSHSPSSEDGS